MHAGLAAEAPRSLLPPRLAHARRSVTAPWIISLDWCFHRPASHIQSFILYTSAADILPAHADNQTQIVQELPPAYLIPCGVLTGLYSALKLAYAANTSIIYCAIRHMFDVIKIYCVHSTAF